MTVADVPFDLVEAKLGAPTIRPGTVAKQDVIERLRASRLPFATVIAPAGYGKTTLLAEWSERDPRPFAWVALDGRDDDGVLFLRYIAAAIHRVEPVAPEVFDALSGPGASIWSTGVPRVGGALATLEGPLVLVLDDLHTIGSCLDVVAALCEYVPSGSQIVIASRETPALPLARWRTRGWLQEIGVADLRLDEQEAQALLRGAGVELDAAQVADLTERTEGWPAGLYLAALSLQAGAPGTARVETFTGEDRLVADYFRFELLSRLPEAEARFLMQTSVLERMCGGLCDAVLQTRGPRPSSSRSSVPTASSCHSTVGASGTASTTCSASYCETSSSVATPKQSRSSTAARWPGAWPTIWPRRRSVTAMPPARPPPWPAWSTGWPCRCITTGAWRP